MKTLSDPHIRRDLFKLGFMSVTALGIFAIFALTPALSAPALAAVIASLLLSPVVATLERRGYPRTPSILALFAAIFGSLTLAGMTTFRVAIHEWDTFRVKLPGYWAMALERSRDIETELRSQSTLLESLSITDPLVAWGRSTGSWFVTHGADLMGSLIAIALIAPILTYFLLNDGPVIRKRFFQLVPNRFFEPTYSIIHDIAEGISDYIRAKVIEAFLLGAITTLGLWLVGAPYAVVLGIVAGVANIVPYAGPILGAAPGLLAVLFDPSNAHLGWWVAGVYVAANLIDFFFIFPVVVAKLVNVHPVFLLAAVAVGQRYYGLIGMLISVPIAASLKVVIQQVYYAVYERAASNRPRPETRSASIPDSPPSYSSG